MFTNLDDIFSSMGYLPEFFGGMEGLKEPFKGRHGHDLRYDISISFGSRATGVERKFPSRGISDANVAVGRVRNREACVQLVFTAAGAER